MITLTMKSTRNLSMICKHDDEKHNDEDADLNAQIMKSTMMKMPTRSEAGRMALVSKLLNRQLSLSEDPPLRKLKLQDFVEDY